MPARYYRWTLLNTPSRCVCGSTFTTDYAMICHPGGVTFVHHNDVLSNVCNDVAIEPPLQSLSGEVLTNQLDDTRADIHHSCPWILGVAANCLF